MLLNICGNKVCEIWRLPSKLPPPPPLPPEESDADVKVPPPTCSIPKEPVDTEEPLILLALPSENTSVVIPVSWLPSPLSVPNEPVDWWEPLTEPEPIKIEPEESAFDQFEDR